MPPEVRRGFVIFAAVCTLLAVVWAARVDYVPPADFALQNGTDPKTIDPHRASGVPEGRIIFELFEGLMRLLPEGDPDPESGILALTPQPAMARSYEISDDGKVYTFHLRDDIYWSDGSPVTAQDFAWSWQRMLHPETASEYGYLLNEVALATRYNLGQVEVGDRVEVELWDRDGDVLGGKSSIQNFPRGTIRYGVLRRIEKPSEPDTSEEDDPEAIEKAMQNWRESWIYHVDMVSMSDDGEVDWEGTSTRSKYSTSAKVVASDTTIERTHGVLVAFAKLGGSQAVDDKTFVVTLDHSVPYFLNLVAFYPTFPVNRKCIETHGSPLWTKQENIVTNGPYQLEFRRLRDRLRMRKNPLYYAKDQVDFETVDFVSLESQNTALNMYETGQLDWVYDLPTSVLEELQKRDDFFSAPKLSVYFYKVNTAVPPLDDVRVRQAISMAIDRRQIVEEVTKGGQVPATTVVPPGLAGYQGPEGLAEDVERAKALLAEAGYPGGRGFPKVTVLYNTSELHRPIAEVIQQQLQNNLNIKLEIKNMEWGSFQETVQQEEYEISRYGWVGDYPDPNTFLDLWVTESLQSNTNWSNPKYDQLIREAGRQFDSEKRMAMLREAETLLVTELPIIPIYFYTSGSLCKPDVEGFFATAQDMHPLRSLRRRDRASADEQE